MVQPEPRTRFLGEQIYVRNINVLFLGLSKGKQIRNHNSEKISVVTKPLALDAQRKASNHDGVQGRLLGGADSLVGT